MRLHVPSLPHTQTTRDYDWCAYTAKCRRLPSMLQTYGHDVILYSFGRDESGASEHVCLGGPEQWDAEIVFNDWDVNSHRWQVMNRLAIEEIQARICPGDAVGIIAGLCQQSIADAFPKNLILEYGIGYSGTLPTSIRAFESRAWQAYVHGFYRDSHGRFFDTVIPNAFDPDDFLFYDTPDDYLLFVSRPDPTKGIGIVAELAKRFRVVTAGQGPPRIPGVEHRGIVRGKEKAELFARARAVLVPTQYIEPFGGVCVEALMSGVPAITTDFGAFPELISQGEDGYRCSTLADFIQACDDVDRLPRRRICHSARLRFSTYDVAPLYDRWLTRCATLYQAGWYTATKVDVHG